MIAVPTFRWPALYLLCALALFSSAAQAQTVYTCRDAEGRPLRGQFPPEQCVGEICATNPQTGKQSCTPAPEGPALKAKREAAEKRQRECRQQAREHVLDDLAFLDRYRSDEMIEEERAREAVDLHRRMGESNKQLDGLRLRQKRLDDEAAFYGSKNPMPQKLRDEIEGNRRLIESQVALEASLVTQVARMTARYDGMLKRRHGLIEKGSTPVRCEEGLAR